MDKTRVTPLEFVSEVQDLTALMDAVTDHPWLCHSRDGWTIYARSAYLDAGVPERFVPAEVLNESGVGKHAITREDGSVGGVVGVWHLDWLYFASRRLLDLDDEVFAHAGLDPDLANKALAEGVNNPMQGRGSQAGMVERGIRQALNVQ